MAAPEYIELHARSAFSFLRGGSLPETLAETAARLELPALGLCDRMGVYGAPRFRGMSQEVGLRAIYGAELAMDDGSVLAVSLKKQAGYQNLCELLTRSHLRAPKGQGVVHWEELPGLADGLIALTGDEEGPLQRAVGGQSGPTKAGSASWPLSANPPTPDPSQEGSRRSCAPQQFPSWEGSGVGSWAQGASKVRGEGEHSAGLAAGGEFARDAKDSLTRLWRAFGPNNVFVEIQRHRRRPDIQAAVAGDERSAPRDAGRTTSSRCVHLSAASYEPRRGGKVAHDERRAISQVAGADEGVVRGPAGGIEKHRATGGPAAISTRRSRLPVSKVSSWSRRDHGKRSA